MSSAISILLGNTLSFFFFLNYLQINIKTLLQFTGIIKQLISHDRNSTFLNLMAFFLNIFKSFSLVKREWNLKGNI